MVAARKAGAIEDVLLLCEHPHVITLGRSGNRANLLASENVLRQKGVEYFETHTRRGHHLSRSRANCRLPDSEFGRDSPRRSLVRAHARRSNDSRHGGIRNCSADRLKGKTGIWVGEAGAEEKLAAIGVHISRWVTSHGFAYNVATDLRYFDLIVPVRHCRPQGHVAREIVAARCFARRS